MQEAPRGTYSNDADFDGARPLSVEAQLDAVEAQIKKSDLTEAEAKAIKKQLLSAMEAAENQGDYLRAYDLEQALEAKKIGNTPANAEPASEPAAVTDTTEPEDIDASNLLELDSLAENPNQAVPFDQLSAAEPPKSPEPAPSKPDVLKPGEKQTIDVTNWPKSEHPIEAQQLDAEMRRVIALLLDPKFNPLTPTNELKKLTRYIAAFEQSITGTANTLRSSYTNWIDVQTFLEDTYLDQAHQVLEAAKRRAFEQYLQDLTTNRFPEIGQLETALKLPLPTAGEGKAIAGFIAKIELSRQDLQQIIENPRHPVRTELPDISGKILESLSELEEQAKAKLQELDVLWAQYNLMKAAHPTARPQEFAELVQAVTEARAVTKAKQAKTPMERLETAIQAIENYQLPNLPTNGVSHQFAAEAIRSFNDGKKRFIDVAQGEMKRLEQLTNAESKSNSNRVITPLESTLMDKELFDVIKQMETAANLSDEVIAKSYENAVRAKMVDLLDEIEDEHDRESFGKLIETLMSLFEFNVLTSKSISGPTITVISEEAMLSALSNTGAGGGALGVNIDFNANPLVVSGKIEGKVGSPSARYEQVDAEQYMDGMGLIQKMVCVMYHIMKDPDRYLIIDGKEIKNPFDRSKSYSKYTANNLVSYVAGLDSFDITDEKGVVHSIKIKEEIERFPEDVQAILRYVALMKASRDDLGTKASNFIMAKYSKSPKTDGLGAAPDAAGYLARAIYKSTTTSDDYEYTAIWSYVDPTKIEGIWGPKKNDKEVLVPDKRFPVIGKKIKRIINYFNYLREGWGRNVYPEIVWTPQRWDEDHPSLDEYTNRMDGLSPADKKKGREAIAKIIAAAYGSTNIKIRPREDLAVLDITNEMKKFTQLIAEAAAYIGKPVEHPGKNATPEQLEAYEEKVRGSKYHKFHGLPLAASKFFVANILMRVPSLLIGKREDQFNKLFSMGSERRNNDAERLYDVAVNAVINQINNYDSISGEYARALKEVAGNKALRPTYRDPMVRIQEFHMREFQINPESRPVDPRERDNVVTREPVQPFVGQKDTSADAH